MEMLENNQYEVCMFLQDVEKELIRINSLERAKEVHKQWRVMLPVVEVL